jgi:hypothetical protein
MGAYSTGGTIGTIEFGAAFEDSATNVISLAAEGVKLKAEWDLDGDTKHTGDTFPDYFFITSGGAHISSMAARLHVGDFGTGIGATGVMFAGWQQRWYWADYAIVSIPIGYGAGAICMPGIPDVEIGYKTTWFHIPFKATAPTACVGLPYLF